jgi:hypothetical protein
MNQSCNELQIFAVMISIDNMKARETPRAMCISMSLAFVTTLVVLKLQFKGFSLKNFEKLT